ncbi:MAG: TonB-dependent receptor [Bacteroidetes bacterium]|nr:MAG: TonB-dependent receptor [Bacteroidota bacterium]
MATTKNILAFLFALIGWAATAQTYSVNGKVVDETGAPAFGVSVYLHETLQGVSTDTNGNFAIKNVKRGRYHLHVRLVGYKTIEEDIEVGDSLLPSYRFQLVPSSLEVNEVVVESNALKLSKKESSVDLITVDEGYLQKNMGTTLMNSLDNLPGINSINMGVGVAKPVIRGMAFNRVAVADNGVKQEGQQWGADHGLEIDQFSIDQIEILKGPASLIYGSDAIGGVIHLKHPVSPLEGKHSAGLLTNYKSVNQTYGISGYAQGNHKGLVYRARVTALGYGDYKVPADSFTYNRYRLPIYNNTLKNTAGTERHVAMMLGINRNWGYSHLTVSNYHQQIGVFSGALGIPRSYQLTSDGNSRNIALPNQQINHFKVISNSNIRLGRSWLEADLGYQYNQRDENSNPHNHGVGPAVKGSLAHRLKLQTYTANLRYHATTLKRFDGVYGINTSYQQNRFEGYEFLLPNFTNFSIGGFAIEKWRVNKALVLNGGLRFDYGRVDIKRHLQPVWQNADTIIGYAQRTPNVNRNFYSWSGSVGAAYNPNKHWSFKFNFGKSFRMPTPQELSVNGVHHGSFRHEMGDSSLMPEAGYQTDLGISVEKEKFLISVTPFFNYFSNYIYLRPTAEFSTLPEGGQVYRFTQTEAIYTGGEVTIEFHPVKTLHLSVTADMVYTYNVKEELPLPFTPPPSIKPEIEWEFDNVLKRFENVFVRVGYNYTFAQNRTDRNELNTPSYSLVNMGAGFDVVYKKKKRLSVSALVQNLGDARYLNHLSRWRYLNLPEPGRNFVITVTVPVLDK